MGDDGSILIASCQSKPRFFFRSFRAENLRLICSLLEIFDGSRDAKIMKNFKTQRHKGRLNLKRNAAPLIFKFFP